MKLVYSLPQEIEESLSLIPGPQMGLLNGSFSLINHGGGGGGGNKSYLVVSHPLWQWVGLVLFWESMWGENNLKLDFLCRYPVIFYQNSNSSSMNNFFATTTKNVSNIFEMYVTNFYERRV